jgi:two-component system sensor histidine kinase PilS (NtrC family)
LKRAAPAVPANERGPMSAVLARQLDAGGDAPNAVAPDAFWKSLFYFNLSRMILSAVLLGAVMIYGDGRVFGSSNPTLFYHTCVAYFLLSLGFAWALNRVRTMFSAHLAVQAVTDMVVIIVLLHASGGIRSGLGILLLMPLAAAASVSRGRTSLFFAALATFALFVENAVWVLRYDIGHADFLPVGLMAGGCFAVALVTNRLAKRLIANEDLVRRRSADLRNQLEINRLVLRDMPSGVLVIDSEGTVRLANPEAQRLLGGSWLGGQSLSQLSPELETALVRWKEASGPTYPHITFAGRELQLRMLEASGGAEGEMLIFLEDASKMKQQAQQVKLAALGRLTANIAHEIRNPLSAISHAAELLAEEAADDPMQQRLTRMIGENAARLDRIVQEVLQLNRRDRATPEAFELLGFLQNLVDQLTHGEKIPAEAFVLHLPADTVVHFDRQHLNRVLWNLVLNAWRHSRKQARSIGIVVFAHHDDRVELHVTDDGPGVGDDHTAQLFEPFFTTESRGTGLGLYIARELAAANRALLDYVPQALRRSEMREWTGEAGADFRLLMEGHAKES